MVKNKIIKSLFLIITICLILFGNDMSSRLEAKENNFIINASLLNNPKFHLLHELPYRTMNWTSSPRITGNVKSISNISNATIEISVLNDLSKIIYSSTKEITFKNNYSEFNIELLEPLLNPAFFKINIYYENNIEHKQLSIKNVKLYGKVTNFEGAPIKDAWITILNNNFQIATSDKDGNYSIYLPRGEYNCIAAATKLYPQHQLENYIWNLPLLYDTRYDFKLGRAEVFRLMADIMPQNKTISGSFISFTSSGISSWINSKSFKNFKMDESMMNQEYLPQLKIKDVKFYLDDIEIKDIPLFEKTDVLLPPGKIFKNAGYKFEFFLPPDLPKLKYHTLKVLVSHSYNDKNGNVVIEQGQATLHDLVIFN